MWHALSTAQVSVNRSMPVAAAQKGGPSGSAYVTFYRPEDALRCIEAVDGSVWDGEQQQAQPIQLNHSTSQHSTGTRRRSARLLSTAQQVACAVTAIWAIPSGNSLHKLPASRHPQRQARQMCSITCLDYGYARSWALPRPHLLINLILAHHQLSIHLLAHWLLTLCLCAAKLISWPDVACSASLMQWLWPMCQAVDTIVVGPVPFVVVAPCDCRQDHQGVLWYHQVLQCIPEGRHLQQPGLPVPARHW